ncbi:hypothetical protein [Tessaracoccus palaemonis]|uniref:Uncharacterized protein n=1 Tax=Tessaracoccus palaemonis TaxID=2829499 RepID=A0ABX8SGF0_9ACTN|nr:hypothetical protein [Tessaracoccus palaemonis]QXT62436.1 hypothetical protein KDB89_11875 [Tessaracoccus palaemonis]
MTSTEELSATRFSGRVFSDPDRPEVLFTTFDVAAYTRDAQGRIAVDAQAVAPLDDRLRADLEFLWRLDSAGLSETRAILGNWTGNEARITAFVATWAVERMWLAWALRDILAADGPKPEPRSHTRLTARLRDVWVERAMPVVVAPVAAVVGESITAGHMLRLALQEASLQATYAALLPRLDGEAARVVTEIIARRATIVEFFELEASARIARSRTERLSAKGSLLAWRPLRIVGVPDPDEDRALASIFSTPDARAGLASVDARIRGLLDGRGLIAGTDRFGGPPPLPSPGLLHRRSRRGVQS